MTGSAAERFWAFSLALYDRPGVAPACLSLQDRCGLDVNLLLFCCWAAGEARTLSETDLQGAIAAAAPWQDAVLRPLRAVRRRLKDGFAEAPAADGEALRRQVAAAELDAERIEQRILAARLPRRTGGREAAAPAREAAANLRLYLKLRGVSLGAAERAELSVILAAAFPGADPADLSPGAFA